MYNRLNKKDKFPFGELIDLKNLVKKCFDTIIVKLIYQPSMKICYFGNSS